MRHVPPWTPPPASSSFEFAVTSPVPPTKTSPAGTISSPSPLSHLACVTFCKERGRQLIHSDVAQALLEHRKTM
ncbi:hypothetical protein Y1Q_0023923 [Alligator mississippiensis]|uniref:Uncharacterized protein n=1 Tax=Alligator mississippiensis TaxID=8496 RepID=A0A151MYM5_ALLMI|nr:hypothetical protein Y1Q_0023923 [Alligator mississippiensis]